MTEENRKIPKRIAQTVLNSLKGGVVPRVGLPYITVGRKNEIEALLRDVDIISEGGASFRFIVGRYGSGKSFRLQTIRNYVMDRGFIVADADLSPERRLQGTNGQGLATYRELIGNLSTKTKPEGGALTLILDRWISHVQSETVLESGLATDDPSLTQAVDLKIHAVVFDRMIEDRFQIPMRVHPEYSLIDIDLFQIFDGRFPAQDDSIDFYDSFFDSIHVFSSHDTYDISDYSRNSFQKPPAQKSF